MSHNLKQNCQDINKRGARGGVRQGGVPGEKRAGGKRVVADVVWCVVLVGVHVAHVYELAAKQWQEASLFQFWKSVCVTVYVCVTVSSHDGTVRLLVAKRLQGLCCIATI